VHVCDVRDQSDFNNIGILHVSDDGRRLISITPGPNYKAANAKTPTVGSFISRIITELFSVQQRSGADGNFAAPKTR